MHIAEARPVIWQREANLRGEGLRSVVHGRAAQTPSLTNHPKRA